MLAGVAVAALFALASSTTLGTGTHSENVAVAATSKATKAPTTDSVSFRRDVAPVLTQSCSTRSCHGADTRSPMLNPQNDAAKLRAALVNVAAEERPDHMLVRAGNPDASYLIQKIEGHLVNAECTDHDCGDRMPLDNPALPENTRRAIRTWISEGAKDN